MKLSSIAVIFAAHSYSAEESFDRQKVFQLRHNGGLYTSSAIILGLICPLPQPFGCYCRLCGRRLVAQYAAEKDPLGDQFGHTMGQRLIQHCLGQEN